MEIGVGYSENIERVSQVILEAATQPCQRPEWKDKVLADPSCSAYRSTAPRSVAWSRHSRRTARQKSAPIKVTRPAPKTMCTHKYALSHAPVVNPNRSLPSLALGSQ